MEFETVALTIVGTVVGALIVGFFSWLGGGDGDNAKAFLAVVGIIVLAGGLIFLIGFKFFRFLF